MDFQGYAPGSTWGDSCGRLVIEPFRRELQMPKTMILDDLLKNAFTTVRTWIKPPTLHAKKKSKSASDLSSFAAEISGITPTEETPKPKERVHDRPRGIFD